MVCVICRLADVGVSEETCETLALALQSENPHLRELNLSNNYIGDSGLERLCAGLISPNCSLTKLRSTLCLILCLYLKKSFKYVSINLRNLF